jgi:tmRNA-binding protein
MAPSTAPKQAGTQQVAVNRKALHNYEVLEKVEAGLSLMGTARSNRSGRATSA